MDNVEELLERLGNSLYSWLFTKHEVRVNEDDLICVTQNREGLFNQKMVSINMRIVPVESCRGKKGWVKYKHFKEFHLTTTQTIHPWLKNLGRLTLIVISATLVIYISHVLCTLISTAPEPNGDLSPSITISK